MTSRGFIFSLSLTGAAAFSCWLLSRGSAPGTGSGRGGSVRLVHQSAAGVKPLANIPAAPVFEDARTGASPPLTNNIPQKGAAFAAYQSLTAEELTERAARVEQEANHDLRRLVQLLDLSEEQQDKVFQTLAAHSPSWTPALQVVTGNTAAISSARKKSDSRAAGPLLSPEPSAIVSAPNNVTDEIMSFLNLDQQDTLAQEELDRAAWWQEVLSQITPPDDVPALDGSAVTPSLSGSGEIKGYEGSEVLE